MFRFYLRCLQLAFTGAWGAVSTATTLIGIVLAAIADKKPAWASDTLISQLNALGGWVVPLVIFSSILLVRLVLAPYWIYKEHHDKLQRLQMRRPNFRVHKALVPLAPQLFPPVPPADTNGPPLGVVTFDLDFVNVGGATAYHTQFIIHYCWLNDPARIMVSISAVGIGDTIPGEHLGWKFAASQICSPDPTGKWWFDKDGLYMWVLVEYILDLSTGQKWSDSFWLHWSPYGETLSYAGKEMVEHVTPHILRFQEEQQKAAVAPTPPLLIPDTEASPPSRA